MFFEVCEHDQHYCFLVIKMLHVYLFCRQILLIGGSNPIEDVEKFKDQGYVKVTNKAVLLMSCVDILDLLGLYFPTEPD